MRESVVAALSRARVALGATPVIVYQMAKVGSSAVVAALQAARLPVFHVHRMDAGHLAAMREARRRLGWYIPPVPRHDRLGLRLRRDIFDRGREVAIVTLVRDPVARNLSSYFEHLDSIWHTRNAHESISAKALADGFGPRYTHAEPLTWFDDEMLPVTGIDVYQRPFPASGSLVISTGRIRLLILKSEMPDAAKGEALSAFIGRPNLTVTRVNATEDKSKGEAFRRFVSDVSLPDDYLRQMLESRYARHFYSDSERKGLWERYASSRRPPPRPSAIADRQVRL